MDEKQSQVDPKRQAMNVENAGRGEALTAAQIDADLARLGLSPTALALVGGPAAAVGLISSLRVAVWMAGVIVRAGLVDEAAALYEISQTVEQKDAAGHVWLQREGVAREVARRVLGIETNRIREDDA